MVDRRWRIFGNRVLTPKKLKYLRPFRIVMLVFLLLLVPGQVVALVVALSGGAPVQTMILPFAILLFVLAGVARVFRRPLAADETAMLQAVFEHGFQQGQGFAAGINDVIEALLQSPQFLYRIELGAASTLPGVGRPSA